MKFAMIVPALAILAPLSPAAAQVSGRSPEVRSFIVTCDCDTAVKRGRIIAAVRRQGGTLLYEYKMLGGLAVTAPKRGRVATFERRLRRIPGVIAVRPDGVSQTTTQTS
ncbi:MULTISPECIES: hypothetical protein [unclassified Sphingomonas]|uniref:hypothetical protein n=1 Tax=unclassified Sphingomonas TaxID=196159 RepID=UPI0006F666AB|nr:MULTISPECIES: hypothetical protein [unclassified Sphingomonas]KQM24532.1 hypothetical protein ASE58_13935 [Sphingomonas sp. Leaf9]KQM42191.1 hypothetical protein ASE57_13940 [Sphingomonas sp. Leaf11]